LLNVIFFYFILYRGDIGKDVKFDFSCIALIYQPEQPGWFEARPSPARRAGVGLAKKLRPARPYRSP
jgi:hypothetical protein